MRRKSVYEHSKCLHLLQYKAGQHHEWEVAAALWKPYWAIWEQAAQQVNERLIALAHVDTGQRVLDIATGLGEPACTAARRVGPTGWVVATDFSPQMLALAREEATRKGVHNIQFREIRMRRSPICQRTRSMPSCVAGP